MTFLSLVLKSCEDMTDTHEKLNSNSIHKSYFYKNKCSHLYRLFVAYSKISHQLHFLQNNFLSSYIGYLGQFLVKHSQAFIYGYLYTESSNKFLQVKLLWQRICIFSRFRVQIAILQKWHSTCLQYVKECLFLNPHQHQALFFNILPFLGVILFYLWLFMKLTSLILFSC